MALTKIGDPVKFESIDDALDFIKSLMAKGYSLVTKTNFEESVIGFGSPQIKDFSVFVGSKTEKIKVFVENDEPTSDEKEDDHFGKNDFGETWEKVCNDKFRNIIANCFKGTDEANRFWHSEIYEVTKNAIGEAIPNDSEPRRWMIECHMGQNGDGKWTSYLDTMNKVLLHLEDWFERVYLVKWDCDVSDDVSYPIIGVSRPKFDLEEK